MNEYILTEFSMFYKRLMVVENCLKTLLITKYTTTYGHNAYNVLYRYFQTLDKNRHLNDKTYNKIYTSQKNNDDKLLLSINKMYLGEVLNLFSNPVFLKNKVKNNFFVENIQTNNTDFQKKQKALKDFRNCIAHCNERKYSLERNRLIKGLVYFEKILDCNVLISCDVLETIGSKRKLSVKDILSLIYNLDKDYFKDDKLLILLFDDIALINGYTFESLPQRWSIIRQKFDMQKQIKNGNVISSILDDIQIQLNFDSNITPE